MPTHLETIIADAWKYQLDYIKKDKYTDPYAKGVAYGISCFSSFVLKECGEFYPNNPKFIEYKKLMAANPTNNNFIEV